MNDIATVHRQFTGRPTRGKTYEICRGYLVRAVPAGKKFHAQIILPNVWNETTYGGWATAAEALDYCHEEIDSVLHEIPALFQQATVKQYPQFAPSPPVEGTR